MYTGKTREIYTTANRPIKSVDLHLHSVHSDGTDTVPALLDAAEHAGIDLFSLTDHDNIDGCSEIAQLIGSTQLTFTPGIEFSCRDSVGRCHILGYAFSLGSSPVADCANERRQLRRSKTLSRLRYIKDNLGFEPTEEEFSALMSLPCPGKPHIARLLADHGYADSIADAIDRYIPHIPDSDALSPERAVEIILASGGIPVLAHGILGGGGDRLTEEELDSRVRRLTDAGLQGMECFYSGYTPQLEALSMRIAEHYSLMPTAGSDYHGSIKPIPIGKVSKRSTDDLRQYLEPIISRIMDSAKP